MSVAFTADAVVERRKTVTRRAGWLMLKAGDRLTLCRKVQGRKGAPLERLAEVEVVSVRRETLDRVTAEELVLEGLPGLDPWDFVVRYFVPQKLGPRSVVTRIEWRYLDELD